jgi:putative flippase GtrA
MENRFSKYYKIAKYLISGGSAAFVTLLTSYICTSVLHIFYLISSVLAFLAGFCVSFVLQKFWTFSHKSLDQIHKQLGLYLLVGLINLLINVMLMYVFVSIFGIKYLIGQFLASGLIAIISYPVYKKFIFKQSQ